MDFQKIKGFLEKNIVLIFILTISFILYLSFSLTSPVKYWDETVYANLGYDLSNNFTDYSFANTGYSDFVPCKTGGLYCWPNAGFRPPLLPYVFSVFYKLGFSSIILGFISLIGALNLLVVYLLAKKLFNKKVAITSAIITGLVPIYAFFSGKMLNDILLTFIITICFILFWKGYEEENNKYKLFFGIFLAIALLARYTALWFFPAFIIYIFIRRKFIETIKNKYFWISVLLFFIVLSPWMLYGMKFYGNPFGAFIHGFEASSYWGGVSSWTFFFAHAWQFFSIIWIVFVFAFLQILYKKDFLKRKNYFLLIFGGLFFGMLICMPHKEDRFILPIVPIISIICASFLCSLNKKMTNFFFVMVILVMSYSIIQNFSDNYKIQHNEKSRCFLESMNYLENLNDSTMIITDESSPVYYYTKLRTHFYPNHWNLSKFNEWSSELGKGNYYILFSQKNTAETNRTLSVMIEEELDKNAKKVFSCSLGDKLDSVYKLEIK